LAGAGWACAGTAWAGTDWAGSGLPCSTKSDAAARDSEGKIAILVFIILTVPSLFIPVAELDCKSVADYGADRERYGLIGAARSAAWRQRAAGRRGPSYYSDDFTRHLSQKRSAMRIFSHCMAAIE
jgi:hypothetical protein